MVDRGRAERSGQTLYHVIRGASPVGADFLSMLGKGKTPNPQPDGEFDPETLRRAAGVSCFALAEQARGQAAKFPSIGSFIAELFVPSDECGIEVARTSRTPGHFTVWASPAYFVAHVVNVTPL
jgi:hypothetical protein